MNERQKQVVYKKFHFLYKTTCLITGKYYFGMHSTDDIDDGYLGSGKRLRYSIKKYGKENHRREIYGEMFDSRESLRIAEEELISKDRLKDEMCMNLIKGGSATPIPSIIVRQKMSDALRGKPNNKFSKEALKKIAKKNTGKKRPEWVKQKISNSHKGKILSVEHKQKIRNSLLGRKMSEEAKQKMSEVMKGRTFSDASIKKMSDSKLGHKASDETRQKLKDAWVKRRQKLRTVFTGL